jgi:hypothetical protein
MCDTNLSPVTCVWFTAFGAQDTDLSPLSTSVLVLGGEGLIKKGYDPETGMALYQLYFKEEE